MTRDEPPDWALPSWDALPTEPATERLVASPAEPTRTIGVPGAFGVRILGVSEVTRAIRGAVRADPRLADLWVEGEIGRVTVSSAGHAYFALKDERNQLQCVWFRDDRLRSAFEAQAGLRVVAHGRIDLFEPQGALQLYVDSIQPAGLGDLTLRFEALKARLAAEGLFDVARKRRLPDRPATIAVVTSPSGAVWKDICHVLGRRWPLSRVVLVAAQVQGEGAPASLAAALRKVERYAAERTAAGRPEEAPAVTILARGGGSLEDLWAFNDEAVVRAVVAHALPLVCGVGHEADVTLADFAADVRAPTPSAAAEIVVPDRQEALGGIRALGRRLDGSAASLVRVASREVAAERRALDRLGPGAQLASARERAGLLLDRATRAINDRLVIERQAAGRFGPRLGSILPGRLAWNRAQLERFERIDALVGRRVAVARAALDTTAAALHVLGPQATLERGYAIVRRAVDDLIVRDPVEAPPGTRLVVRVAHGEIPASADPRA
jgi:exodeoxyribonuclease VII large subunit